MFKSYHLEIVPYYIKKIDTQQNIHIINQKLMEHLNNKNLNFQVY